MTKLRKVQQNVKDLPKKKKDPVGKVVKKKAATLTQKKKETIVQDFISKKDVLANKVTLKKNKSKSNVLDEKQKPKVDSKKNKNSKVVLLPAASESITKKSKKNAKSVSIEKPSEPKVISKKSKSKEKATAMLKETKAKTTVVAKKNIKAIEKPVVSKAEKIKSAVVSKKNKSKTKQTPTLEDKKVLTKVLTKKEKSALKKVLVPRKEENTTQVISKNKKQKSKLPAVPKEEKIETEITTRKSKRKAESVLQKENTKPEVAVKKTKVAKDVVAKKKKDTITDKPVLDKVSKKVKVGKDSLTRKNLEHSVQALLKVVDVGEQKRKTLLTSEKPPLFLSITCVKIPKAPLHQMRFELPHSLVMPTDDVALFVKDLKRGRRRGFDETIHHFEDLLESHKCKRIKGIIPINQVKTDYRQFEMRRRLLGSYDHFLIDGRIAGHMAHLLGKEFRESRKLPISIHMDKKNLKEEIDRALKKTSLQIHSNGDTYVTQFATCSMSNDEILDNLEAVIEELKKSFPGGWPNIRSLRIKSPLSLAIPIYMTLKNRNDIETPTVEAKRPKAYKSVEGELSTFTSNVRVTVAPDGTVDVLNLGGDEDEEEFDKMEEEDAKENEKKKVTKNVVKDEDDNEDEDEEDDDEEEEEDEEEEDEDNEDEDENESDA